MNTNIFIKNTKKYNSIIDNIDSSGVDNLFFLVDFDKTLTKAFIKGEEFPSLISLLRKDESILGQQYSKKAYALYNYYVLIEKNPCVSHTEKDKKMTEWWRKHQALLVESGLTQQHIQSAVDSGYLEFREGIERLIELLTTKNIPLVIMSASGIGGESIRMFFQKYNLMNKNIHIISNVLEFDAYGKTCGFKEQVIHSFNKSGKIIEKYPTIQKAIEKRKNIILLGDSLGDPNMADGLAYEQLLKIGLFNNKSDSTIEENDELFQEFSKKYDVILSHDSDLNFINNILEKIK